MSVVKCPFKLMGPWIETEVNIDAMETVVAVNGQETIRFKTKDMLFGIESSISAMSQPLRSLEARLSEKDKPHSRHEQPKRRSNEGSLVYQEWRCINSVASR